MNDYEPQIWESKIGNGAVYVLAFLIVLNIVVQTLHYVGMLQ